MATLLDRKNESLADRLREIRHKRGLSMNELGKSAGVTHGTISQIEAGKTQSKVETIRRIAGVLGCSHNWLLTGAGDPFPGVPEASKEARRKRAVDLIGGERIDHFAERAGVDVLDAIGLICDGALPAVKSEMVKMAQALGSTVEWIVAGIGSEPQAAERRDDEGDDRSATSVDPKPAVAGMTCVPFVDPMAKSEWARDAVPLLSGTSKELHFPSGFVPEGCYALMVRSATMAPEIQPGDILVVTPVDTAFMTDGDYVVVTWDGSLSVRRVRVLGEGFELSNLNPQMPEKAIAGELRRVFSIVLHISRRR